jgi:hypothetical protein
MPQLSGAMSSIVRTTLVGGSLRQSRRLGDLFAALGRPRTRPGHLRGTRFALRWLGEPVDGISVEFTHAGPTHEEH